MKYIKTLLLTMVGLTLGTTVFAHALWIETNTAGKVGQAHAVKIFYGEYAENERDVTSKWYSDVKELTLWLVGPDKQKIKLATTLGDDVATASFTPEKDGQYTLLVSHPAKDLAGTTQYHFLTSAAVYVGKTAANVDGEAISNELKIFPESGLKYKVNAPVKLKAIHNGANKAEATVSVFSPSGWSKVLKTTKDGVVEFTPEWPGRYVVEVTDYQTKKGEVNGKAYESLWQGSTFSFEVK
ncbi:DUF4198 domain-containing protein [Pedobacter sp. AW31-3R]|uniref:DUF4198 domain-containing protein n=1 Tax=Pedobacter sp. AW31-3R TaxID=3445781 RepID=UPI003FA05F54